MTRASAIRAANIAWDEHNMVEFDRLVRTASEADIVAFLEPSRDAAGSREASVVTRLGPSCTGPGREQVG